MSIPSSLPLVDTSKWLENENGGVRQKRALDEGSLSSASSQDEPSTKRRKVEKVSPTVATTSEKVAALDVDLQTLLEATPLSLDICQILRTYHTPKENNTAAVECYIVEHGYDYILDSDEQMKAFDNFVKKQKVDLNKVVSLDLSSLNYPIDREHLSRRGVWTSFRSDCALERFLLALPHLQKITVKNNQPLARALMTLQFSEQEHARCKIDTIEISQDLPSDKERHVSFGWFERAFFSGIFCLPQLRTLIVTGSPFLTEAQKIQLKAERAEIAVID